MISTAEQRFVVGDGRYVEDTPAGSDLWVCFVRSSDAHARIDRIDRGAAESIPGVVEVVTAAECDLPLIRPDFADVDQRMTRTVLAKDTVRFVGEPLAAVLADSRAAAYDAAALIEVHTTRLVPVAHPDDALADTTLIHTDAGTNVCYRLEAGTPIDFDSYDVVVTERLVNQRVAACPIEGRSIIAAPDGDRTQVRISAQGPHPVRDKLAEQLGIAPTMLTVTCPDVGGGFGAKAYPHPEEVIVVWLSRRHGRAVRWTETRSEAMATLGHGRGQIQHITLAGDVDGTLRAYRLDVTQDAGAYPRLGSFLPFMAQLMMSGCYRFDQLEFHGRSVVTNTNPTVAYRGAGRPEATAAIERAVDLFAAAVSMDPAEIRRMNLLPAAAFPFQPGTSASYDAADLHATLETALDMARYEALRTEQQRRRAERDPLLLGIGMATYIEITAASPWPEDARVQLRSDGGVDLLSGTCPQGQGHDRTWRLIAAPILGVSPTAIDVTFADSDTFATGTVTAGSRSAQIGGIAVRRASLALAEAIRMHAADLLEANPDDLELADGRVFVTGSTDRGTTLAAIAQAATTPLSASEHFTPTAPTYGSGTHVAVVEVDTTLGAVRLLRMIAVDDGGVILDPVSFHGQVHGGVAQGIGQALSEEIRYGADGTLLNGSFIDYLVPSAAAFPMFETAEVVTQRDNELGAGGIGESGAVGSTPAVQNAVIDALAHLGVRHLDLPLTPERVWRAISDAVEPDDPRATA